MLQAIATFIAAAGVFLGILTLRAGLRQRHRQFEAFYVQRYWSLMDRLSLDAIKGHGQSKRPSEDDERVVRSYFMLCEDECDLRAEGWISDATWEIWHCGMKMNLDRWPFNEVCERVQGETGQFTNLKLLVAGEKDDFLIGSVRRTWSFGLLGRPGV